MGLATAFRETVLQPNMASDSNTITKTLIAGRLDLMGNVSDSQDVSEKQWAVELGKKAGSSESQEGNGSSKKVKI